MNIRLSRILSFIGDERAVVATHYPLALFPGALFFAVLCLGL